MTSAQTSAETPERDVHDGAAGEVERAAACASQPPPPQTQCATGS